MKIERDRLYKFKFQDTVGVTYVAWAINGVSCYRAYTRAPYKDISRIDGTLISIEDHDRLFPLQAMYTIGLYIDAGSEGAGYYAAYTKDAIKIKLKRQRFARELEDLLV